MKNMVSAYLGLYEPHAPHSSIADISASLNFTSLTSVSASDYLAANGVNSLFTHELVDAATRVNYGQNVDDIHALEGMVSLAANGAQSVIGGNWQIFDLWAKKSGANVRLETAVKTLRQGANGKWHVGVEGGAERPMTLWSLLRRTRAQTSISIRQNSTSKRPSPQSTTSISMLH